MAGPLDELGEDPGALFRELVEWSTRPSFGSIAMSASFTQSRSERSRM